MIALTQEKREELIACANEIKKMATSTHGYRVGNDAFGSNALVLMEVALASLTAEPFGYVDEDAVKYRDRLFSAQVFADEEDLPSYEFSELSYPLYLAPPVPEIKLPGISELVEQQGCLPAVRDVAIWDFAISEIKRLNGLGE